MKVKGYKGFHKGMICNGEGKHKKQYALHTEYEEPKAELCRSGMHFCENPFDVFGFYPFIDSHGELNEFAKVEADGSIVSDGCKSACTHLKIEDKCSIPDMTEEFVHYVELKLEEFQNDPETDSSMLDFFDYYCIYDDDCAQYKNIKDRFAGVYGDHNHIVIKESKQYMTVLGDSNQIVAIPMGSCITSSGFMNIVVCENADAYLYSNGQNDNLAAYGSNSRIMSAGDCNLLIGGEGCHIASTGHCDRIASLGDRSIILSCGDKSATTLKGENSTGVSIGEDSKIRGKIGDWITLAEWKRGRIVSIKSAKIDGKKLKEDTFYKLEHGKFVQAH